MFYFITLFLAFVFYSLKDLQLFGKLSSKSQSFFGQDSWARKYIDLFTYAPDNWYYRLFDLKFKERFPGSGSIFVFLTDGVHLFQLLFRLSLSIAIGSLFNQFWLHAGLVFVISITAHHAVNFVRVLIKNLRG